MKIALTGVSGYVGSRIAACLRAHGHQVIGMGRRPGEEPWVRYALGDEPRNLPWEGVEVLIHAAHDFTPRTWRENVERNVDPGIALLAAAKQAGVRRLIFISSVSAFEGCRSNYGKAKFAIETAARELGAVVVRPGLVWGDSSGGVMGALEKLVAKSPLVPYLTGGDGLCQFLVYEEDLALALTHLATVGRPPRGEPLVLAHSEAPSLLKILQRIARRRHLARVYLPVHWRIAMTALHIGERIGVPLLFRSDSLVGLVYKNPNLQTSPLPQGGEYRPFA